MRAGVAVSGRLCESPRTKDANSSSTFSVSWANWRKQHISGQQHTIRKRMIWWSGFIASSRPWSSATGAEDNRWIEALLFYYPVRNVSCVERRPSGNNCRIDVQRSDLNFRGSSWVDRHQRIRATLLIMLRRCFNESFDHGDLSWRKSPIRIQESGNS